MPAQALLNAGVERLINTALAADPDAAARLQAVQGKCFRLRLSELPWPFTLCFCADGVVCMGSDYEAIDGEVSTSLSVLPQLSNAAQVSSALQRGDVSLSGDPIFAQQASQVVLALNIDWEEAFAKRLGDVPGYWLGQAVQAAKSRLPEVQQWRTWLSETLTEEKKLAPGALEYALFCDQLKALEHRLARLEAQRQATHKD